MCTAPSRMRILVFVDEDDTQGYIHTMTTLPTEPGATRSCERNHRGELIDRLRPSPRVHEPERFVIDVEYMMALFGPHIIELAGSELILLVIAPRGRDYYDTVVQKIETYVEAYNLDVSDIPINLLKNGVPTNSVSILGLADCLATAHA